VPRTFILHAAPILRFEPPVGPEWLHEVKHDGFRVQIHLAGGQGHHLRQEWRRPDAALSRHATAVAALPFGSLIIDAELVACDADGTPNFYALMRGARDGCCAYCFDLLELDGRSLVARPLEERRGLLRRVMRRARRDTLRVSETLEDPLELMAACEKQRLEGIFSKRRDAPYVSGSRGGWIKVETAAWREANRERHKLFEGTS